MRSYGMGGQQFRQFFAAGTRSSLLGPVPMGMAIKTPMMGFPAPRMFHPHARYHNNTTTASSSSSSFSSTATTDAPRQPDRKRDSEQMAAGGSDDQPATSSTNDTSEKTETALRVGEADGSTQPSEEQLEEPVVKKQRTEGSERSDESEEQCVIETVTIPDTDGDVLSSECNSNTDGSQPGDCILLEEGCSTGGSDIAEALEESRATEKHTSVLSQVHSCLSAQFPSSRVSEDDQQEPAEQMQGVKVAPLASLDNQEEGEEGVADGANKFYCYLCGITCHNQQNFRSHMNSMSHQQRMMEIQHMSNACLVTLLPRVQESLQGAIKDGEKKADKKHWCATCHIHFTSSITDHRRTKEHKLASRAAVSSCTVCKKHFRTSQIFVEHLQSQEHRQRVEKLEEQEGCEALANLTATDTDGFSLEEVESSEVEEGEEALRDDGEDDSEKQDDVSSLKEVTLQNMSSDEQYDPDTVYGSSFFVPVAGFICRLCNKFYHFESSALHSHCKSLKHFENLKRHKEFLSKKDEAANSSTGSVLAADRLSPGTQTSTHCLEESFLFEDSGLLTDSNSKQPSVELTQITKKTENQQHKEQGVTPIAAISIGDELSLLCKQGETTSQQDSAAQGGQAESKEEADVVADEDIEELEDPAAATGKKSGSGKAKNTLKRRSGRATNRR